MFSGNKTYRADLQSVLDDKLPWELLEGKKVIVTGATGLIGSFLTDALLAFSANGGNLSLYITGRDGERARKRFPAAFARDDFHFVKADVAAPGSLPPGFDYIIHAASNADPASFASDPAGIMDANYIGTRGLLECARSNNACRFLFVSSGEVYGEPEGDMAAFREDFCGRVDFLSPRACYPSSKRAAETLCACYHKQYNTDIVIARPCHVYGPTITATDSRAHAQFVRQAAAGNDIVMKSAGAQLRSYCHVADAVAGLLHILLKGGPANAYNIANPASTVTIREFAGEVAAAAAVSVRFETPSDAEKSGYSKIPRAVLDSEKLQALGWTGKYDIHTGIRRTLEALKEQSSKQIRRNATPV
jgi:nucleoside-diphosphate-sugar epimerase